MKTASAFFMFVMLALILTLASIHFAPHLCIAQTPAGVVVAYWECKP